MGRKVQVFGEQKGLAECTQQDIEALSRAAEPALGLQCIHASNLLVRLGKVKNDEDAAS